MMPLDMIFIVLGRLFMVRRIETEAGVVALGGLG